MTRKYLLNLIAVLAIIAGLLLPAAPAAAQEQPGDTIPAAIDNITFDVAEVESVPYLSIDVDVNVTDVSTDYAMQTVRHVINYDKTKITYVGAELGSVLPGAQFSALAEPGIITPTLYLPNPAPITVTGLLYNLKFRYIDDYLPSTVTTPISLINSRIDEGDQGTGSYSSGSLTIRPITVSGTATYWKDNKYVVGGKFTTTGSFTPVEVDSASDGSFEMYYGAVEDVVVSGEYLGTLDTASAITPQDVVAALYAGQTDTLTCPLLAGDISGNNTLGELDAGKLLAIVLDPASYTLSVVFVPNYVSIYLDSDQFIEFIAYVLGDCTGNLVLADVGGGSAAETTTPTIISAGDTFTITFQATSVYGTGAKFHLTGATDVDFSYSLVLPDGQYLTTSGETRDGEGFAFGTTAPSAQVVVTAVSTNLSAQTVTVTGSNDESGMVKWFDVKVTPSPQTEWVFFLPALSR